MRERERERERGDARIENRCIRTLILNLVNPFESLEDRVVVYI